MSKRQSTTHEQRVMIWAQAQIDAIPRHDFDNIYDQWFFGQLRLSEFFSFTLIASTRRALHRAMERRNFLEN